MDKTSTIKNLFRGNIRPNEAYYKKDSLIAAKFREQKELNEKLLEAFGADKRELINEYDSLITDITEMTAEQYFIKGFQLAVRLMVDAMNDDLCDYNDITGNV